MKISEVIFHEQTYGSIGPGQPIPSGPPPTTERQPNTLQQANTATNTATNTTTNISINTGTSIAGTTTAPAGTTPTLKPGEIPADKNQMQAILGLVAKMLGKPTIGQPPKL